MMDSMPLLSRFAHTAELVKDFLNVKLDVAFGLDIADRSIELVELRRFWKPRVAAYGRITLEPGVVERGAILYSEALTRELIKLLASTKPRKVSTNKVILSISESEIFLHLLELPARLTGTELGEAVLAEAAKIIPIEPHELYADWQVVGTRRSPAGETISVLFAAVPRAIVDEYLILLNRLGLELVALDVPALSLGRVLRRHDAVPQAIVDAGARVTSINLFDASGAPTLSLVIPFGGDDLGKPARASAREALLRRLAEEIQKALRYHETKYAQPIKTMILSGGAALLPGFAEGLRKELALEVTLGDPLKEVAWRTYDENVPPLLFANAIGLALRGLTTTRRGMNLLRSVPKNRFAVSQKLRLFALGHLNKTTVLRAIINNNPLVVLLVLAITLFLFGFEFYRQVYLPFAQGPFPWVEQVNRPILVPPPAPLSTSTERAPSPPPGFVVVVTETPTGWLNVRSGPGASYPTSTRVYPGESYPLLDESEEWYQIKTQEAEGWISKRYARREQSGEPSAPPGEPASPD